MATVEDAVEDLADLYASKQDIRSPHARELIERVARRRAKSARGPSKAVAARMLQISVPTLDKWIQRGRVPLARDERSGRPYIPVEPFAVLYLQVRTLREQGKADGVLAAAIAQLERDDRRYQSDFQELYGEALASMAASDLRPVEIPPSFGPDD